MIRLRTLLLLAIPIPVVGQWNVLESPDLTANPGWWEDPIEATSTASGWAGVWDVYDSAGARVPWVWNVVEGTGDWSPLLENQAGFASGIVRESGGFVTAATAFSTADSTGILATGSVRGWEGSLFPTEGVQVDFLSDYSELHGLGTNGDLIAAVGMGLDPCCVHRELPAVALFEADGSWVESFGGGKIALDISIPAIIDTLDLQHPQTENGAIGGSRHDEGGTFHAVAFDGNYLLLGGAYANALHHEVMLARISLDGELDAAFGQNGWVHWNVDPGNNTWVESLEILPNGVIQCLVRAHAAGDLEPAFHVLHLQANGQLLALQSSQGSDFLEPHGLAWGGGAWTSWGADGFGAVVGRWLADGEVESQNLPGASGWQAARGAWNGSAMAVFGRELDGTGEPVARLRIWQTQGPNSVRPAASQGACSEIFPNPCPLDAPLSLPFKSEGWYGLSGGALPGSPNTPGWYFVRTPLGQICPVVFQ